VASTGSIGGTYGVNVLVGQSRLPPHDCKDQPYSWALESSSDGQQRDLDKAWSHHERAIALNPNDPRIVGQRGELSMYRGDLDEAVRSLEQAARLDPLSATSYQRNLACTRYLRRELDEAARLHAQLAEARPDMIELGAAIAAMRGDDVVRDRALQQLLTYGARVNRPTRPFATDTLRRLWREGFERAGISLS
jgi:tetratricopeptide (TPR) repeat protein